MRSLVLACLLLAAPLRAEPACAPASGRPVAPAVARHIDDLDRLIARGRRNGWLAPEDLQRLNRATQPPADPTPLSPEAACALRDVARRAEVLLRQDFDLARDAEAPGGSQTPYGALRLR